jgi:hypothetical protein
MLVPCKLTVQKPHAAIVPLPMQTRVPNDPTSLAFQATKALSVPAIVMGVSKGLVFALDVSWSSGDLRKSKPPKASDRKTYGHDTPSRECKEQESNLIRQKPLEWGKSCLGIRHEGQKSWEE